MSERINEHQQQHDQEHHEKEKEEEMEEEKEESTTMNTKEERSGDEDDDIQDQAYSLTSSSSEDKKDSFFSLEDLLVFEKAEFEELSNIEDIAGYSDSLQAEIYQLEREIACECKQENKNKILIVQTTLHFNPPIVLLSPSSSSLSLSLFLILSFLLDASKVTDFVKLHTIITESAQTLRVIKDTLDKYEESLRETTSNIADLRTKSGYISTHLTNRTKAKERLDESLRSIIITPRLVETITKGPINSDYCQCIEELSRLLNPPKNVEESVAFKDACTVTALLRSIATMRIRDFLIQQFQNLAKPGANFQIYQQSILDRFRNLNHFLIEQAPHFEGEIRDAYLETLGPVIYSYFVIYFGKTSQLYFKVGDNEDLLGMAPETKRRCIKPFIQIILYIINQNHSL